MKEPARIDLPIAPVKEPAHDCAQHFLKDLCDMSPTWKLKIDALMEERGFNHAQALGNLAVFALDTDNYLVINDHPFFNDVKVRPQGTKARCPSCQQDYVLDYPGRPYCSNRCADQARAAQ